MTDPAHDFFEGHICQKCHYFLPQLNAVSERGRCTEPTREPRFQVVHIFEGGKCPDFVKGKA